MSYKTVQNKRTGMRTNRLLHESQQVSKEVYKAKKESERLRRLLFAKKYRTKRHQKNNLNRDAGKKPTNKTTIASEDINCDNSVRSNAIRSNRSFIDNYELCVNYSFKNPDICYHSKNRYCYVHERFKFQRNKKLNLTEDEYHYLSLCECNKPNHMYSNSNIPLQIALFIIFSCSVCASVSTGVFCVPRDNDEDSEIELTNEQISMIIENNVRENVDSKEKQWEKGINNIVRGYIS